MSGRYIMLQLAMGLGTSFIYAAGAAAGRGGDWLGVPSFALLVCGVLIIGTRDYIVQHQPHPKGEPE